MKKVCITSGPALQNRLDSNQPASLHRPTRGLKLSCVTTKPVFRVSYQVQHKSGSTTTGDGLRLEISALESRDIILLAYVL